MEPPSLPRLEEKQTAKGDIVVPGGCSQGLEEEESRDKRGLQAAEAAH